MNKKIVLFVALLTVCYSSIKLHGMEAQDEESCTTPGAVKELAESQQKKNKSKKKPAAQSAAAGAFAAAAPAPTPAPLKSAISAAGLAQEDDDADAPELIQKPAQAASKPVQLSQSREVELDASSLGRKVENYVYGTDVYLLHRLSKLADHQVFKNDANTQLVINSAVLNLIRKDHLQSILTFVQYAQAKRMNDPVIPLEQAAAKQLQDYLTKKRNEKFAAFHTTCQEQMHPITTLGKLIDNLSLIRGIQPQEKIDMSSLSYINLQALDKIMKDMADNKSNKNQKHSDK